MKKIAIIGIGGVGGYFGGKIAHALTNSKEHEVYFVARGKHLEAIWEKFMFIASYGLVTACYNKTLGEVYASEEYAKSVKLIMETIYDISKAMKIGLGHDIVEQSYKKAALFPFETKTSFQRDYELKDKPDE